MTIHCIEYSFFFLNPLIKIKTTTTIFNYNSFYYINFKANVVRRVGYINFPHLMQITLLRDYLELIHMSSPHAKKSPSSNDHHRTIDKTNQQPNLNLRSKIFELSSILDCAKVSVI